jgi:hypothetical protein
MSRSRNPRAEWSGRKKPLSRYFKGLVMPPVEHPPGAVPEAFQARLDPRKTRFVLWFLVGVLVLFSCWAGFGSLRRYLRNDSAGTRVCCGCGEHPETSTCPNKATCPTSRERGPGCLSQRPPVSTNPHLEQKPLPSRNPENDVSNQQKRL